MAKTKEPKFTPGPWTSKQTGDGKRYIIGDGQSKWGTHVAEVYSDDTDGDEAAANAHLIQHAPDLYDAVKALLNIDNTRHGDPGHVDFNDAVWMGRAALAKSEGR